MTLSGNAMCVNKRYLSNREFCKVTFILPDRLARDTKTVHVAGEFNNWDPATLELKKVRGKFTRSIKLKANQDYQFRYLINGTRWENDLEADRQLPSEVGNYYNSVVSV